MGAFHSAGPGLEARLVDLQVQSRHDSTPERLRTRECWNGTDKVLNVSRLWRYRAQMVW
jgi:hypothetical protein